MDNRERLSLFISNWGVSEALVKDLKSLVPKESVCHINYFYPKKFVWRTRVGGVQKPLLLYGGWNVPTPNFYLLG